MARYMRSYGRSFYTKPAVVDPAVVFRRPQSTLSAVNTRQTMVQRAAKSRLAPPSTLAQVVAFVAYPVAVVLAKIGVKGRKAKSKYARPSFVNPAVVFRAPQTTTAAGEIRTTYVQRRSRSTLAPPATLQAFVAFVAYPIRVSLAEAHRLGRRAESQLRPPAAVGAAAIFRPVLVALTQASRLGRKARSQVRPPAVVAAATIFRPVVVALTQASRIGRRARTRMTIPAVVNAATVFRAPLTTLAAVQTRISMVRRGPKSQLPLVVRAAATFVARPVFVAFAKTVRSTRKGSSLLRAPAVVNAATVFRAPFVKLAALETRLSYIRRGPHSSLPLVIRAAAAFIATPIRVLLTRRILPSSRERAKSDLQPPAVVAAANVFRKPVAALVAVATRTSQGRRAGRSFTRPMIIFPFIARAVQQFLQARQTRQSYQKRAGSRVGKPAVVGAAAIFRPIVTRLVARTSNERVRRPGKVTLRTIVYEPIGFITGFFRRGRPGGPDPGTPDSDTFDAGTPGGPDAGTPDGDHFDAGTPDQGA